MSLLEIIIVCIVIFICLFSIVDRICKCCEQCGMTKAFGKHAKTASEEAKNGEDLS